jgi:hypothetical protein
VADWQAVADEQPEHHSYVDGMRFKQADARRG